MKSQTGFNFINETVMEETKTMTAERSLEIIAEVMEQNRRTVTGFLRTWLLVAGKTTIGIAVLAGAVGVCLRLSLNLLLPVLPLVIYFVMKHQERSVPQSSLGVVGMWVKQVWISFALLGFCYAALALVVNYVLCSFETDMMSLSLIRIDIYEPLWLLLGMAVGVTGILLRRKLLVVCGLAVGVFGFYFWHFSLFKWLLIRYTGADVQFMGAVWQPLKVAFAVAIFGLVGMILPAMLLKKESK